MSKRTQYSDVAIDIEGNALEGIEVTVYQIDDLENETAIYTGRTGSTNHENPFETDATGLVQFWLDPGTYQINWSDTEVEERISDRQIVVDSVSGDEAGIPPNRIEPGNDAEFLATVDGEVQGLSIDGDVVVTEDGHAELQEDSVGDDELAPAVVKPFHLNGNFIKRQRFASTTNLTQNTGETLDCTWTNPFANDAYTVVATAESTDGDGRLVATIRDRTATKVVVNVWNDAAATVNDYVVHLIAFAD